MMKNLIIKKCSKCGALIKIITDCHCENCEIVCCNEKMIEVKANSQDASHEKHIPTYEIKDGKIIVQVNHVMDSDHYIEWIGFVTENGEEYIYLNPNEEAVATFNEAKGTLYSYCNKHGLWMEEVK